MIKLIWTVAAISLMAPALAQQDLTNTVVTVNGEDIKAGEYYRRMEFLPGVGKQVSDKIVIFPPGFLTLEELITERLVLQLAKDQGLGPSDAEVQAEYQQEVQDNPQMEAQWQSTGQSKQDLMDGIKYSLAQFKIVTQGVNITDQEVSKFYADNPSMFTIPKRFKLRMIAVQTDAAVAAADADLTAGKAFADVAKDHSDDVSKVNGGDIGTSAVESMPEYFRTPISATAEGQSTGWIAIPNQNAKAKFFVEKITPAEVQPLDAKLKRAIRKRRMLDIGGVKNNIEKLMAAERAKAKIDIKNKSFADAYKTFVDTYLREQAKSGGG